MLWFNVKTNYFRGYYETICVRVQRIVSPSPYVVYVWARIDMIGLWLSWLSSEEPILRVL